MKLPAFGSETKFTWVKQICLLLAEIAEASSNLIYWSLIAGQKSLSKIIWSRFQNSWSRFQSLSRLEAKSVLWRTLETSQWAPEFPKTTFEWCALSNDLWVHIKSYSLTWPHGVGASIGSDDQQQTLATSSILQLRWARNPLHLIMGIFIDYRTPLTLGSSVHHIMLFMERT